MPNPNAKSRRRLTALTHIVRKVDTAPDLESALRVLVRHTRDVMGADVCTVYVTDEAKRRHVVAATDGLSSRVVGNVQFGFGKGLKAANRLTWNKCRRSSTAFPVNWSSSGFIDLNIL